MVAKLSGVQSGTTLSKKEKKKENLFTHSIPDAERAMTAQKCSKKRAACAKLLFC